MMQLNSPFLGQLTMFFILILTLCFAESLRNSMKHGHHNHNPHDDARILAENRLSRENKRLRAERNSYLSFGALFMALIISQLWTLLKRVIALVFGDFMVCARFDILSCFFPSQEENEKKQAAIHEALVKQVTALGPAEFCKSILRLVIPRRRLPSLTSLIALSPRHH